MHRRIHRLTAALCLLSLTLTACQRDPTAPEAARTTAAMEETSGPVLVTGEAALERLSPERRERLAALSKDSQTPLELVVDARTGTVLSVGLEVKVGGDGVADRGRRFLEQYQQVIDPAVNPGEYQLVPPEPGCFESVAVFDRVVDKVPVLGSRITLFFDGAGALTQVVNGVTSAPAKVGSVEPASIEGARPLSELLPERFEGELRREKVYVPLPGLDGLFEAELVQWAEAVEPKRAGKSEHGERSTPAAAVVVGGIAITDKLRVTGGKVSQPPPFDLKEPEYLDRDGLPLPEFISYRRLGGLAVNHFPWEQNPVEMAYRFLEEHPSLMRTFAARCQFAPRGLSSDPNLPGAFFVRLAQKHGPLPVFGSELVVVQEGLGRVMSIAGRTLDQIDVADAPLISPQDAVDTAGQTLLDGAQREPQYQAAVKEALSPPAKVTLGVLPAHLQHPAFGKEARLAFQVRRGQYILYVDARSREVLASEARHVPVNIVRDALGMGEPGYFSYLTVDVDGVPTGAVLPPNFDNAPGRPGGTTAQSVRAVELFFTSVGWRGLRGNGAGDFVANTNVTISTGCNAFFDLVVTNDAFFCLGLAANDVVGHEFTHGVIQHSSDLLYLDQSGAINEGYADLMGNLIFPDTAPRSWLLGEFVNGTGPALRDMAFPGTNHMSGFRYRDATCTNLPWSCDFGFVHTNSGILDRAHVLLADGIVDFGVQLTPGIGRSKLKLLAFLTMTRRLPMDARMNDVPVATRDVCEMLVARGATDETGAPFTVGDCDQILHAFNQVGLNGHLDTGWQEPVLGWRGSRTFYGAGETTPGGCPVTNVVGDLFSVLGTRSADLDPTTPMPTAVNDVFSTQGIAFRVSPFSPLPPPLGTSSMTHTIDWFNIFGSEPRYATTVASAPLCAPPITEVERVMPGVFFDNLLFGNGGITRIGPNPSRIDPPNCFVSKTEVELVDGAGNVTAGPGAAVTDRVSHCVFGLCAHYDQTAAVVGFPFWTAGDLSAPVRWSYHVGRGPFRMRLRYTIQQSNGAICLP